MTVAGVVAALAAEARTLGTPLPRADGLFTTREGSLLAVSGIGLVAAATSARALIEAGAGALVSWGMAGGLDPALPAGTLCLPIEVTSEQGECLATDPQCRELLLPMLVPHLKVVSGKLLTSARAIEDADGKAAAFRATGAAAVDMESLGVARIAAQHAIPFIAMRVIVDTAADALPDAVIAASAGRTINVGRLLVGVLLGPGQIVPLIRLAARYRTAIRTLTAAYRTGALTRLGR